MKTQTSKSLVLSYFGKTKFAASAQEAIDFINCLQYRGNSYSLECNAQCKETLNQWFDGTLSQEYFPYQLATTGCSTTRIRVVQALAETLEQHEEIIELREREQLEKKEAAEAEWYSTACEINKGWYIVTLSCLVSRIKGNDGTKMYSFKVLANSQMDAFNKASELAVTNLKDPNVSFVYTVQDNAKTALIEFIGVWTDECEEAYGQEA